MSVAIVRIATQCHLGEDSMVGISAVACGTYARVRGKVRWWP